MRPMRRRVGAISLVLGVLPVVFSAAAPELYERLGLAASATEREIRKAWHWHALKSHPDKVQGGQLEKEQAEAAFKRIAEAYEVLSDSALRAEYDRTGEVPSSKARAEAASSTRSGGAAGDDDEYGFEGGGASQGPRTHFGYGRWGARFDQFEVGLAQGRARRVRSLEGLRRLLQPVAGERRYGLVGFYRQGQDAALKQTLRFPYPFAGWSLATQGGGFWWEDALQTALVSVGALASTADGAGLLHHFGLDSASMLPVVAWVRRDDALSFDTLSPTSFEQFLDWVYRRLTASIRITNRDHRTATVWWLDGTTARKQGVIAPGGTFEHSSYLSHRWYCWPVDTEGHILSEGASLGELTVSRVGELHELTLEPRCIDSNGHCSQWQALGECRKNPGYMTRACARSCGDCDVWGWLYPEGLARLHDVLSCWAEPSCAKSRGYTSGGHAINGTNQLKKLPAATLQWLETVAPDDQTRRAIAAFQPSAPPPVSVTPLKRGTAPPPVRRTPPPPPRDEL